MLTCLQNVPTMDLLQYQRQIESELSNDGYTKLIFKGPSKDGLLLQGDNAIEQLEHWKVVNTLYYYIISLIIIVIIFMFCQLL